MQNKAVILTGMMGSGKTSTGVALAKLLKCNFIDIDEIIEKKHGKITQIFNTHGEEYFRDLETKELQSLLDEKGGFVLSLGGGAVLRDKNIEILKKLGTIFYLEASCDTIYERIKNQTHRPLLQTENPKKTIQEILNNRINRYEESGIKINTDSRTIQEIAEEIYEKVKG